MYDIHRHMKRTQLYLDEEVSRLLAAESRRRQTTVSALVREAVATAYGRQDATARGAITRRLAGVWADRDDLADTATLVRAVRRSTRPRRWQKGGRAEVPARQRRHH